MKKKVKIKKKDDMRCLTSSLKFPKNSINNKILNFQMLHSKNIFNSAIFFLVSLRSNSLRSVRFTHNFIR
jgi:hypothetical protein